jgi:hypothetical protein
MVECASNLSYVGGVDRRIVVQDQLGQKAQDSIWKITKAKKRDEGMAQVEECLSSKHETLI